MSDHHSVASARPRRLRFVALGLLAVLIAAAVVLLPGSFSADQTKAARLGDLLHSGQAKGFNLLLITLDTTRKDALGCYGYRRAETPAVDSLVTRGVRFDDAVSSAPTTAASHATMFTGLYPPNHGVRNNGTHRLTPDHETLATVLKRHGYDTAAVVASFILDQRYGLSRGFDHYDAQVPKIRLDLLCVDCTQRPGDMVTDAAVEWLKQRPAAPSAGPFFLWVHYYDPHIPRDTPFVNLPRFAGRPYDAEIAFMDVQLKRLLDQIDRQNLRDRTLIAVATDHGESLGEHEEELHGMFVYGCATNVGLILSCPTLFDRAYRVEDRIVGLVDLRPTLEDLLGISPSSPSDGVSLLKADADPDRAIYMETLVPLYTAAWSPLYALQRHGDKYILAPEPEYYDLKRDPHELHNQESSAPSGMAQLARRLAKLMERWPSEDAAAQSIRPMDADETKRLAALGYVGGAVPTTSSKDLPDPKVMIKVYNMAGTAQRLLAQGKVDEALPLAEEVVAQSPTFVNGHEVLARIYVKLNRPNDAVEALRQGLEYNPTFTSVKLLAQLLLGLNRYEGLEPLLDRAESLDPGNGEVAVLRGDCFARQGRLQEARDWYQRAIRNDENRIGALARDKLTKLGPP